MTESRKLQNTIKTKLSERFPEVVVEWNMAKNATDAFSRSQKRYAPRLDVAAGPFNISPNYIRGEIQRTFANLCPVNLKRHLLSHSYGENPNPRCTLGIEVVYSGNSKHILGDFTNASMMGLYGIVIPQPSMSAKVNRIYEYIKILKSVGKSPPNMFNNLVILSPTEFLDLL